jgi:hypothetical protein
MLAKSSIEPTNNEVQNLRNSAKAVPPLFVPISMQYAIGSPTNAVWEYVSF